MHTVHHLVFNLILLLQIKHSLCQYDATYNECMDRDTCTDCIKIAKPQCAWCNDIYYNYTAKGFYKQCDTLANHERQKCSSISNPKSSSVITKSSILDNDVRVSPQAVDVKLRPGQPASIVVDVKTPKNFPIDLYYLMDMSFSMKDDKDNIVELGKILQKELKDVTDNFRIGFGGYVDKPVGPYTRFWESSIAKFMEEKHKDGIYPQRTFAFKNFLPLDKRVEKFSETLKATNISYNVDFPEGLLDALLQVVVCRNEIGWRDKKRARRIVIVTTDATFHFAGDGLLGGMVVPNDGACHLINNHDTGLDYDYASLSLVRAKMLENEIVPIFATLGNTDLYGDVAGYFGEASGAVASALANDSSNVVPLIKEAYEKIAKVVNVKSTKVKGIDVDFEAKCHKDKAALKQAFCNNVAINEQVSFEVSLDAKSCDNAPKNVDFLIKTNFDDVNVTLGMICDCGCDGQKEVNSTHCNKRGDLSCGKCFCGPLFSGRFCQCTAEESKDQSKCKVENSDEICSDKGECECGECNCRPGGVNNFGEIERIHGDQCQCSNTSCPRDEKKVLCSGPDHGKCQCGECKCLPDWQGEICDIKCEQGNSSCFQDGIECSGNGVCKCNTCQCNSGYIGDFCSECVDNCPDACQDYGECVKCSIFDTSDLTKGECEIECKRQNITDHVVKDKVPEKNRCIVRDEDDCSFVFSYIKNNITDEVKLLVQRERICPAEPDILAIILGVIAGIVGIGLALLLIWKLLATIQDRREFARFDKETKNAKWNTGENPIFKQATSTFKNPMYGNQPANDDEDDD